MSQIGNAVDAYLAAWNEREPGARSNKIAQIWSPSGTYIDPLATVAGQAGLDRVIAGAQQQFPAMAFVRGRTYEEHHNVARFTWELVPRDGGDALVVGFDVATIDDDGRINAVVGFLDKVPA